MSKQNGSRQNGSRQNGSKQNRHIPRKPRRPPGPQANFDTAEEAAPFNEYLKRLREWLDALDDEAHDRALKKLTSAELGHITADITYENYMKGGPLRELLEGTCFPGTL